MFRSNIGGRVLLLGVTLLLHAAVCCIQLLPGTQGARDEAQPQRAEQHINLLLPCGKARLQSLIMWPANHQRFLQKVWFA